MNDADATGTADDVIRRLGLSPHPEGGHFVETWRHADGDGRALGTAIYFLLREDERSHWHRIDATEIWHHYAGAPIELSIAVASRPVAHHRLGPDLASGARPQLVVEPGAWQAARPIGGWALVGCTVVPGFDFTGFELAPPGWAPPGSVGGLGR